jgi:hypothetical protein
MEIMVVKASGDHLGGVRPQLLTGDDVRLATIENLGQMPGISPAVEQIPRHQPYRQVHGRAR